MKLVMIIKVPISEMAEQTRSVTKIAASCRCEGARAMMSWPRGRRACWEMFLGPRGSTRIPCPPILFTRSEKEKGCSCFYTVQGKTADTDNAHVVSSLKIREAVNVVMRARWRGAR